MCVVVRALQNEWRGEGRSLLAAPGAVGGRALRERIWETRVVETDCR
jgi:hypothetical protein